VNICLVDPAWTGTGNTPPLGLGYLAAVARREGARVTVLPLEALGLDEAAAAARILADGYDLCGLTCNAAAYPRAARLASRLRREGFGGRIVFGGVFPTFAYRHVLRDCPAADGVVRYEGEGAMAAFARHGWAPDRICGLVRRITASGKWMTTRPGSPPGPLDELPEPDREALRLERFAPEVRGDVLSSRGCGHRCGFCSCAPLFRRYRTHSPQRVVGEVAGLARSGVDRIHFIDDSLTADAARLEGILEGLAALSGPVQWSCSSRVDTVTPGLLQKMAAGGCRKVFFGVESLNPAALAAVGKATEPRRSLEAMTWTQEAGMVAKVGVIVGLPGETPESMRRTVRQLARLGVEVSPGVITPVPGTRLWRERRRLGIRLVEGDWERYDFVHPVAEAPGFPREVQEYFFLELMALPGPALELEPVE